MSFYARRPDREFSTAPEGLWPAVCVDLVDKGQVTTQYGEQFRVQLRFELEETDPKSNKPYLVTREFNNSMHKESNMRKFIEAWRGRKFQTEDEAYEFDLERLLTVNCQLSITHNISNGGTYANIVAIVGPAKNGIMLRPSKEYVRVKDRPKRDSNGGSGHASKPQGGNYDPFNDGPLEQEHVPQITDEDFPF